MPDIAHPIPKAPTGIAGLDEITGGGLPAGRASLVAGGPGCGKTLLAIEFLVQGALQFGEPGVLVSFEEPAEELILNAASAGLDLPALIRDNLLIIDYVHIERGEIEEAGSYDLSGLFIRIGHAIDTIGAKRVAIDTLETLFAGLPGPHILRAELRRLFRWLKDRGITVVATSERGEDRLTQAGLEDYISDCVILLDHRVRDQLTTRRMRIVKYRGSAHGTNEYPFLIDDHGVSVLPVTSVELDHPAPTERVSSGVAELDAMMGGPGYYVGSSVLVSGTAGSGKTSLAAHFAAAASQRGERTLYFAFEESRRQIIRNMRSIGIDLEQWEAAGLLKFVLARPSVHGLEMHLVKINRAVAEFRPAGVILDPVTSLMAIGDSSQTKSMLLRLIDTLKSQGVTAILTSLTGGGDHLESTDVGVSSLIDTWLLLRDLDEGGRRRRTIHLIKSRGMAHSNHLRTFHLTDHGLQIDPRARDSQEAA